MYTVFCNKEQTCQTQPFSGLVVLQHLKNVVSMDFHAKKDNIFFADVGAKTIYKAKLDDPDSKEPVITDNAKGLEGIAIDWVNDKLYWVDRHTQHMYVSELDGSNRMTVKTGIKDARALVLHPGKGLAFFTRYTPILRSFTINKRCIFSKNSTTFYSKICSYFPEGLGSWHWT